MKGSAEHRLRTTVQYNLVLKILEKDVLKWQLPLTTLKCRENVKKKYFNELFQ